MPEKVLLRLMGACVLMQAVINEYGDDGIDLVEEELLKRLPGFLKRLQETS